MAGAPLLEVRDLQVVFHTYAGLVQAVRGVSFSVAPGEMLAVVGESGCGKSVTAQTILRLLPTPPAEVTGGQIMFEGRDLLKLSEREMQQVRGEQITIVFQDPISALNPTATVGNQIAEVIRLHESVSRKQAWQRAIEMLQLVGIPDAMQRVRQYPHQFSGGMRQRAMIALALACRPKLLIADEPTTALDVTVQAQILALLKRLQKETGAAVLLITHDLGVVAEVADRVVVMYAGEVIEQAPLEPIFYAPRHPYTWGLLRSVPRLDRMRQGALEPIEGTPPDLLDPPPGCAFAPRCRYALRICREVPPLEQSVEAEGHRVRCWLNDPAAPAALRRPWMQEEAAVSQEDLSLHSGNGTPQ